MRFISCLAVSLFLIGSAAVTGWATDGGVVYNFAQNVDDGAVNDVDDGAVDDVDDGQAGDIDDGSVDG